MRRFTLVAVPIVLFLMAGLAEVATTQVASAASLEVFSGATSLGIFSVSGDSDFGESKSAPFLGIHEKRGRSATLCNFDGTFG
jgi:hypothetical protein